VQVIDDQDDGPVRQENRAADHRDQVMAAYLGGTYFARPIMSRESAG
jgi:hypothetical protein